jgi:beta-N-acetylhexosaminidase
MTSQSDLRRLAFGVLLPGFAGTTTAPDWLREALAGGLGGVTLFGRNVTGDDAQVAELTADLRAAAGGTPVIAIDEEGGDVTRLDRATGSSVPGNHALGAADDLGLTTEVATAMGQRLAACGITLDLAPPADLTLAAQDPIIGVRAFGADPALAAKHVAAWVTGLQAGGVAACAKHFPGHGAATEDSHHSLPVLQRTEDELRTVELVPFGAAVGAGTRAVMTGHLVVPGWGELPASLNPVATRVLRDDLGFTGTIVTDALDMGAVTATAGMNGGAVAALLAGADALCVGGTYTDERTVLEFVDAIVAAVQAGTLPEERLRDAVARTAELGAVPPVPAGYDHEVGLRAARKALVVHGKPALRGAPLVLETVVPASIAVGEVPWGLGPLLAERVPGTEVRQLTPDDLAFSPGGRTVVVVTRDAQRYEWVTDLLTGLAKIGLDLIWVETGVPGPDLGIEARLDTHGGSRVCLRAAAERLAELAAAG